MKTERLFLPIQKNSEQGFTLVEMLFILFFISLLILITSISMQTTSRQLLVDQFFQQFSSDIYYAQTYAISHERQIYLLFDNPNSRYLLHEGGLGDVILTRTYSSKINIINGTLPTSVVFHANGNIGRTGALHVYIHDDIYVVTFQIGKGRFLVKKL